MTLEEAIELQNLHLQHSDQVEHHDLDEAVKLGIEALKRELLFRERVPRKEWSLLPGETER